MPPVNPLIHQTGGAESYVSQQANASGMPAIQADSVPMHLAIILVLSGLGLYALKKAGFRFVVSASGGKG